LLIEAVLSQPPYAFLTRRHYLEPRSPKERDTFGGRTSACSDLPAVDILNLIRKGAAAMRSLATSTVATFKAMIDSRRCRTVAWPTTADVTFASLAEVSNFHYRRFFNTANMQPNKSLSLRQRSPFLLTCHFCRKSVISSLVRIARTELK